MRDCDATCAIKSKNVALKRMTLSASEFKAKCPKNLDDLGPQGIIITKRGQPIAPVIPLRKKTGKDFYGCRAEKITIEGDVFSTGVKGDAKSRHPHLDLAYRR